jgi:hypothetical protein
MHCTASVFLKIVTTIIIHSDQTKLKQFRIRKIAFCVVRHDSEARNTHNPQNCPLRRVRLQNISSAKSFALPFVQKYRRVSLCACREETGLVIASSYDLCSGRSTDARCMVAATCAAAANYFGGWRGAVSPEGYDWPRCIAPWTKNWIEIAG